MKTLARLGACCYRLQQCRVGCNGGGSPARLGACSAWRSCRAVWKPAALPCDCCGRDRLVRSCQRESESCAWVCAGTACMLRSGCGGFGLAMAWLHAVLSAFLSGLFSCCAMFQAVVGWAGDDGAGRGKHGPHQRVVGSVYSLVPCAATLVTGVRSIGWRRSVPSAIRDGVCHTPRAMPRTTWDRPKPYYSEWLHCRPATFWRTPTRPPRSSLRWVP